MTDLPTLPPTFTTGQVRRLGVHPRDLYAWRDRGELVELSRGVFRQAGAPLAAHPDLLAVAYRAPRAIACCLTAASVHELTDALPLEVQIAVPNGTHPPTIDYPPTKVFRFEPGTFDLGRSSIDAAPGEPVPVYDPTRTVVDLIRLRHRLGEPLAYTALRRYLDGPTARPALLLTYADRLGVLGPVHTAVDIAAAR